MQLRLPWTHEHGPLDPRLRMIAADGRHFPVIVARHPRARRYVIRVTGTGEVRLTVPRRASIAAGLRFAERQAPWIAREWQRQQQRATWEAGTLIWYRGERVAVTETRAGIQIGTEQVPPRLGQASLRTSIEGHLRGRAAAELPDRLRMWAATYRYEVERVSVRNQRSRWGACSARGVITLNWRLIQTPQEVADYVMLHELAHLTHPNHSARFWRHVQEICSWWRDAERWLKAHEREIL
jgi:predicted metal-dependent hydrolase